MGYFQRIGEGFKSGFQKAGNLAKSLFEYTPMGVAKSNTDKSIAAQKEMAQYAYSKDLEMWERANAYNSPQAQMQRLRDAGLNPNLVYGNGAVANSSGSLPHYQAPNLQYNYKAPVDLGRLIGLYQDVQMKGAQIAQAQASTRLTEAAAVQREEENRFGLGGYRGSFQAEKYGEQAYKTRMLGDLSVYSRDIAESRAREYGLRNEKVASDTLFNKYRNEWMRAGVTTSDHPAIRMLIRGWNSGALSEMMNRKWTDK